MLKNNNGISIVTLVITIVVIIILASIAIFNSMGTPDDATFAKFLSEFHDFSFAVTNDYVGRNTDTIVGGDSLTDAQIYYWIASGKETMGENEKPVPVGTVNSLGLSFLPENLKGTEYYEITDDRNVKNWKSDKNYYEKTEKHYVTDVGEVFILPGYRVEDGDGEKWWVNDKLYYVGKAGNTSGGSNPDDVPEVAISSISLSETSGTLTVGGSKTLTAEINADATEKLVWESSNTSVVTVTPSADTKSATIKGLVAGTSVIITARNQAGTISAEYTVTEVKEPVQLTDDNIGDFVEYGIEYTDVFMGYTYNSTNGWRLLSQTPVGDGTYNIEIISTGIPAKLYYYYSSVGSSSWAGTDGTKGTENQLGKYATTYYASSSNTNANMKAAAGLLYNFEKINFVKSTSKGNENEGYYTAISGSHSGAGNLFKASNIALGKMSVRSVMHTDIRPTAPNSDITSFMDRAKGLFILGKLKNVEDASERGVSGYSYSSGYYWLASPFAGDAYGLRYVGCGGSVSYSYLTAYGARPVVSISGVQMDYGDGVWQIQE